MAAAWLRISPQSRRNVRLAEHGLQLLGTGTRDAPERQRTLRGALDWSYRLLSDEEQRLFARLSVFVGGATVQATDDVCNWRNDLDVIPPLCALWRRRNLIEWDGASGAPRIRMLHVVRHYAMERLTASGERSDVEAQHDKHFMEFVASASAGLNRPAANRVAAPSRCGVRQHPRCLERAVSGDRLSELLPVTGSGL